MLKWVGSDENEIEVVEATTIEQSETEAKTKQLSS